MSLVIAGNTYPNRETLKALGARYNRTNKTWTLAEASDTVRRNLAALGMTITDAADTRVPITPAAIVPTTNADGKIIVGNSQQYINQFGGKNASIYIEFDSVNALIEAAVYAASTPIVLYDKKWRKDGLNYSSWHGSDSLAHAIRLVRGEWHEGIRQAKEIFELLNTFAPTRRRRQNVVAGGSVNVGRMLAGNPVHMRRRTPQPANKIVTLINDMATVTHIRPDDMMIRAAIIAAVSDALEDNGYSTEILTVQNVMLSTNRKNVTFTTRVKLPGQKMQIEEIIFALGHPSMLRRLYFLVEASIKQFNCHVYGYPKTIKSSTVPANSFVMGRITENTNRNDDMKKRIKDIIAQIVPTNLPISFNI